MKYGIELVEWYPVYLIDRTEKHYEFHEDFIAEYERIMELFNALQIILRDKKEKSRRVENETLRKNNEELL